jgi:hypothetical protein
MNTDQLDRLPLGRPFVTHKHQQALARILPITTAVAGIVGSAAGTPPSG